MTAPIPFSNAAASQTPEVIEPGVSGNAGALIAFVALTFGWSWGCG